MHPDPYSLSPLSLGFRDAETERAYVRSVSGRVHHWTRAAWLLMAVFNGVFALGDALAFGEDAPRVYAARALVGLLALLVFGASFTGLRRHLEHSSALFVLSTSALATYLIALQDPGSYTPYFTGLLFALSGVLTTPGLGFRSIRWSLLAVLVGFLAITGLAIPMDC